MKFLDLFQSDHKIIKIIRNMFLINNPKSTNTLRHLDATYGISNYSSKGSLELA